MKTFISFVAVATMIIASSFTIGVQQEMNKQTKQASSQDCFNYLRVHRHGKTGISLTWSVSAADITSFVIQRSYDGGDNYEDATPNGIGFNGSSSYKYIDNDAFPGMVHYRIAAMKANATTEYSPVESIRVVRH